MAEVKKLLLVFVSVLVLVFGCTPAGDTLDVRKIPVTVGITSVSSRALSSPEIDMAVSEYALTFSCDDYENGYTETVPYGGVDTKYSTELPAGQWELYVSARNAAETEIGFGRTSFTITGEMESKYVGVTVEETTGEGTLSFDITTEDPVENISFSAKIEKPNGEVVEETLELVYSDGKITGSCNLPNGFYVVYLMSSDIDNPYSLNTVRIVKDQTTTLSGSYVLGKFELEGGIHDDIQQAPEIGLAVAESVPLETTLTATATIEEDGYSYSWYLNGMELEGENGKELLLEVSKDNGFSSGKSYTLTFLVRNEGVIWSKAAVFAVTGEDSTFPESLDSSFSDGSSFKVSDEFAVTINDIDSYDGIWYIDSKSTGISTSSAIPLGDLEIGEHELGVLLTSEDVAISKYYKLGMFSLVPSFRISFDSHEVPLNGSVRGFVDSEPYYPIDGKTVSLEMTFSNGDAATFNASAGLSGSVFHINIKNDSDITEPGTYTLAEGMLTVDGEEYALDIGSSYDTSITVTEEVPIEISSSKEGAVNSGEQISLSFSGSYRPGEGDDVKWILDDTDELSFDDPIHPYFNVSWDAGEHNLKAVVNGIESNVITFDVSDAYEPSANDFYISTYNFTPSYTVGDEIGVYIQKNNDGLPAITSVDWTINGNVLEEKDENIRYTPSAEEITGTNTSIPVTAVLHFPSGKSIEISGYLYIYVERGYAFKLDKGIYTEEDSAAIVTIEGLEGDETVYVNDDVAEVSPEGTISISSTKWERGFNAFSIRVDYEEYNSEYNTVAFLYADDDELVPFKSVGNVYQELEYVSGNPEYSTIKSNTLILSGTESGEFALYEVVAFDAGNIVDASTHSGTFTLSGSTLQLEYTAPEARSESYNVTGTGLEGDGHAYDLLNSSTSGGSGINGAWKMREVRADSAFLNEIASRWLSRAEEEEGYPVQLAPLGTLIEFTEGQSIAVNAAMELKGGLMKATIGVDLDATIVDGRYAIDGGFDPVADVSAPYELSENGTFTIDGFGHLPMVMQLSEDASVLLVKFYSAGLESYHECREWVVPFVRTGSFESFSGTIDGGSGFGSDKYLVASSAIGFASGIEEKLSEEQKDALISLGGMSISGGDVVLAGKYSVSSDSEDLSRYFGTEAYACMGLYTMSSSFGRLTYYTNYDGTLVSYNGNNNMTVAINDASEEGNVVTLDVTVKENGRPDVSGILTLTKAETTLTDFYEYILSSSMGLDGDLSTLGFRITFKNDGSLWLFYSLNGVEMDMEVGRYSIEGNVLSVLIDSKYSMTEQGDIRLSFGSSFTYQDGSLMILDGHGLALVDSF